MNCHNKIAPRLSWYQCRSQSSSDVKLSLFNIRSSGCKIQNTTHSVFVYLFNQPIYGYAKTKWYQWHAAEQWRHYTKPHHLIQPWRLATALQVYTFPASSVNNATVQLFVYVNVISSMRVASFVSVEESCHQPTTHPTYSSSWQARLSTRHRLRQRPSYLLGSPSPQMHNLRYRAWQWRQLHRLLDVSPKVVSGLITTSSWVVTLILSGKRPVPSSTTISGSVDSVLSTVKSAIGSRVGEIPVKFRVENRSFEYLKFV